MAVEGFGTWILLSLGGVPMAALLGVLTGLLAFLPNIGAIISGALIILVGFSAGVDVGLYAVFVYFVVQMVDGYLIVPMVAKRAVDLAPALVLGRADIVRRFVRDIGACARRPDYRDDQGRAGTAIRTQRGAGYPARALMLLVFCFLMGIANFAMHKAVAESGHPFVEDTKRYFGSHFSPIWQLWHRTGCC